VTTRRLAPDCRYPRGAWRSEGAGAVLFTPDGELIGAVEGGCCCAWRPGENPSTCVQGCTDDVQADMLAVEAWLDAEGVVFVPRTPETATAGAGEGITRETGQAEGASRNKPQGDWWKNQDEAWQLGAAVLLGRITSTTVAVLYQGRFAPFALGPSSDDVEIDKLIVESYLTEHGIPFPQAAQVGLTASTAWLDAEGRKGDVAKCETDSGEVAEVPPRRKPQGAWWKNPEGTWQLGDSAHTLRGRIGHNVVVAWHADSFVPRELGRCTGDVEADKIVVEDYLTGYGIPFPRAVREEGR